MARAALAVILLVAAPLQAAPCVRAVGLPAGATATCSGVLVPATDALAMASTKLDLRQCRADAERDTVVSRERLAAAADRLASNRRESTLWGVVIGGGAAVVAFVVGLVVGSR